MDTLSFWDKLESWVIMTLADGLSAGMGVGVWGGTMARWQLRRSAVVVGSWILRSPS